MGRNIVIHISNEDEQASDQWMLTFADLLSLILTFFVLLYSMSSVDDIKWEKLTKALAQRLNPDRDEVYTKPAAELSILKKDLSLKVPPIEYLHSIFIDKMEDSQILRDSLHIFRRDDKLILRIIAPDMFEDGSRELNEDLRISLLEPVSQILASIGNHISIYGYVSPADEEVMYGQRDVWPSFWELSLSRAVMVADSLRNMGYPYSITTFGASRSGQGRVNKYSIETEDLKIKAEGDISVERPSGNKAPYLIEIVIRHYAAAN